MTGSGEAAEQLARADRIEQRVAKASRWYATYLTAFGFAALVNGLALAIWPGVATVIWTMSLTAVFIAGMVVYAVRQRVQARRFGVVVGLSFGIWGACWGGYTVLATVVLVDQLTLLLVAAAVQPLPLFIGAVIVRWRS